MKRTRNKVTTLAVALLLAGGGGLCAQQAAEAPPPATRPVKLFTGTFLLTLLVLTKSYSGTLTSFQSVPLMEKPIQTLEEIVKVRKPRDWSRLDV